MNLLKLLRNMGLKNEEDFGRGRKDYICGMEMEGIGLKNKLRKEKDRRESYKLVSCLPKNYNDR